MKKLFLLSFISLTAVEQNKKSHVKVSLNQKRQLNAVFFVETLSGLSNKYVKDYQAIVRFIDDNIPSLNGFG